MIQISLHQAMQWVVLIGAVLAVVIKLYKAVRILEKLHENDVRREKESKLVIKGVRASLQGLIQLKANGPVTDAFNEIDEYLVEK